jgi:hypothetical protein
VKSFKHLTHWVDTCGDGGFTFMVTQASGASIDSTTLATLALSREQRFADDIYEENPVGVFRGIAYAMVFNALLMLTGMAGWEIWRLLR